jgi:hypothetical protein
VEMLARSRLPNWEVKRERTNSQVLTVFFFGVGLVILQMEIDCLRYFHSAPPVDLRKAEWFTGYDTIKMQDCWLVAVMGISGNILTKLHS